MRRICFLLLMALSGCELLGAPAWVRQRHVVCGPAECLEPMLSAVGSAGGSDHPILNDSLRRQAADASARAALAQLVLPKIRAEAPNAFRVFIGGSIAGSEITEHWVSGSGAEYSLAVLKRSSVDAALTARTNLSDEQRKALMWEENELFQPDWNHGR